MAFWVFTKSITIVSCFAGGPLRLSRLRVCTVETPPNFLSTYIAWQRLVETRLKLVSDNQNPVFLLLESFANVFGVGWVHSLFGIGLPVILDVTLPEKATSACV